MQYKRIKLTPETNVAENARCGVRGRMWLTTRWMAFFSRVFCVVIAQKQPRARLLGSLVAKFVRPLKPAPVREAIVQPSQNLHVPSRPVVSI